MAGSGRSHERLGASRPRADPAAPAGGLHDAPVRRAQPYFESRDQRRCHARADGGDGRVASHGRRSRLRQSRERLSVGQLGGAVRYRARAG